MTDDWQYTEEAAPDPHALCCSRCKADREALTTTRQALTEITQVPYQSGRARGDVAVEIARRALTATEDTA